MNRDLEKKLQAFLRELYVLRAEVPLTEFLLSQLSSIVPGDNVIVGRHQPASRQALQISLQHPFSQKSFLESVNATGAAAEHPIWEPIPGDPYGTKCLSDMMTRQQWESHPLYCEFLRADHVADHATLDIQGKRGDFTMIGVLRSKRGFKSEEIEVLRLLGPHLEQAFKNATLYQVAIAPNSMEAECPHLVRRWPVFNEEALVEVLRRESQRWEIWTGIKVFTCVSNLKSWFREQRDALLRGLPESAMVPFMLQGSIACLQLHLCRNWAGQGFVLIEQCGYLIAESIIQRLSRREREVLTWIGQGKTDSEIALILDLRLHTVKGYIKTIYKKLGVRSRTEAARIHSVKPPLMGSINFP